MRKIGQRIVAMLALSVALTLLFTLLLSLAGRNFGQAHPAPRATRALATNDDHASVERTIQTLMELEKEKARTGRRAPTKEFMVSEPALNAYIASEMKAHPLKGVKSLVIQLRAPNQISGTALVDFNQIKISSNEGLLTLAAKTLLSGERHLTVEGTLTSHQYVGTFQITRAELDGMPLPPSLVTMIVKHIGEKQHPPVDITKPFTLPYGIESVEISNRSLKIKA
jgi:hypothetical protein